MSLESTSFTVESRLVPISAVTLLTVESGYCGFGESDEKSENIKIEIPA
jgi:hypothetical protein